MAVKFYALSGSPFSWKVWLALEYLAVPYRLDMLSADAGDLKSGSFLALNPRGKVPVIVDDGFVLTESDAILDYLSETFGTADRALWPIDKKERARARQATQEATNYIYPSVRKLVVEIVMRKNEGSSLSTVDEALTILAREFIRLELTLKQAFLGGITPGAADFAVYPLLAIFRRIAARAPALDLDGMIGPSTLAWMERVESLEFFPRTYPPHWKS